MNFSIFAFVAVGLGMPRPRDLTLCRFSRRNPVLLMVLVIMASVIYLPAGADGTSMLNAADGNKLHEGWDAVKLILEEHCFACHADGANEGSMSLDDLLAMQEVNSSKHEINEKWFKVLKQVQSGLMPPPDEPRPTKEHLETLENWIKYSAFDLDPQNPDPGRVTIRRLNQVEYRNTVRDLLGVDYDTGANFPADDTGHGFDNIGEVLSISPLLLEKYLNAAKEIVSSVVPVVPGVVHVESISGDQFQRSATELLSQTAQGDNNRQRGLRGRGSETGTIELSYYQPMVVASEMMVEHAGEYLLRLNLTARETYVDNQFDENRCKFTFALDDEVLVDQEFVRQGRKHYVFDFQRKFAPGNYRLTATVTPLTQSEQIRDLRLQITTVDLIGPDDPQHYDRPPGYARFFPREVPEAKALRREYAREILQEFATRAFRRPVEGESLDRLVSLAESVYGDGTSTFEAGVAKSMTAILASPRFLFREELALPGGDEVYPLIDEYSLASRLSYFLWSSMPDAELMKLAERGELRENLDSQLARMLRDEKANALSRNFVGQWLRARAVETIQINADAVLSREPQVIDPERDIRRRRFFVLFRKGDRRSEAEETEYQREKEAFLRSFQSRDSNGLTDEVRQAMRRESELHFEHVIRNDLSLLELVDSDYTFLNEPLWAHYQIAGIEPVDGEEMRLVKLPAESPRGGILTQGTTLVVTSNPDRTSPVKRGLFVLENLLGTPPPAPPPNIPALEDVEADAEKKLTLRETLAIHRENALCSSCHNQMDPLGLSLENFNAMGQFRKEDMGQPVDSSGALVTGEAFETIGELKKILVTTQQSQIYRCLTEKLMTYALGRAIEYTDAHTVDKLVAELQSEDGRASVLINGIVHSSAFQRIRRIAVESETKQSLSSR